MPTDEEIAQFFGNLSAYREAVQTVACSAKTLHAASIFNDLNSVSELNGAKPTLPKNLPQVPLSQKDLVEPD